MFSDIESFIDLSSKSLFDDVITTDDDDNTIVPLIKEPPTQPIQLDQSAPPVTKPSGSKINEARMLLKQMLEANATKKEILHAFVSQVNLTVKGAPTYYNNLMKELK
ncbi:MAG: hypothetical protein ACXW07_09730 [Nitrososphaeraceae archaeon]